MHRLADWHKQTLDACAQVQVLKQGTGQAGVVRTSAALLRQLAGSDSLKAELVQQGALDAVTRAACLHASHLGALEQVHLALSCKNAEFAWHRHWAVCTRRE